MKALPYRKEPGILRLLNLLIARCRYILAGVLALGVVLPSQAEGLSLDNTLIASYSYQKATNSDTALSGNLGWTEIKSKNIDLGFSNEIYWIKVSVQNNSNSSEWFLTVDNTRLDFVDFYYFIDDKLSTFHSGDHSDLSGQLSSYPTLKFRLNKGQSREIYLRIESAAQIAFTPAIRNSYQFGEYQAERKYTHILYIVIFILFLFFQFHMYREGMLAANIWYSAGLLFGFLYIFFCYGDATRYLAPASIPIKNKAIFVLGSLSMFSFSQFVKLYIGSKEKYPKFHLILSFHIALCGIFTLIHLLPIPNIARVYMLAIECNLTCFTALAVAVTNNFRENSLWSRFIAVPLIFSVFSVLIYEATFLGLLPFSEITAKLILWTVPVDVLLISISFFYKHESIRENNAKLIKRLNDISTKLTNSVEPKQEKQPKNIDAYVTPRLKNVDSDKVLVNLAKLLESSNLVTQSGVSLELVAKKLGLRGDQLSAIINSQLNTSFSNLINQKRLAKAASMLLSEEQESVLTISELCGFGSKSNFNKLFKYQYEVTPSQYRKMYKQD